MHEVFISYSRSDVDWVNEELIPVLRGLNIPYFIDDAISRNDRSLHANGIPFGADLRETLLSALAESTIILMVLTPEYRASKWCMWEESEAAKLRETPAPDFKAIPLILKLSPEGRMDPGPGHEDCNYVDMHDVTDRCQKMQSLLDSLGKKLPLTLELSLGTYSKRQLMESPELNSMVEKIRGGCNLTCERLNEILSILQVLLSIQAARDSSQALRTLENKNQPNYWESTTNKAKSLKTACEAIADALNSDYMTGHDFGLRSDFRTVNDSLVGLVAKIGSTELEPEVRTESRNQMLERVDRLLRDPTVSSQLSTGILERSKHIDPAVLANDIGSLGKFDHLPWNLGVKKEFEELTGACNQIRDALEELRKLVEVLQIMQGISKSTLRHDPASDDFSTRNLWTQVADDLVRAGSMGSRFWMDRLTDIGTSIRTNLNNADTKIPDDFELSIPDYQDTMKFSFTLLERDVSAAKNTLDKQTKNFGILYETLKKTRSA